MRVHDQPSPSSSSASRSSGDQPVIDREASRAAAVRTSPPVTATGRPPQRSTAAPTTGENAYIPTMWTEMTKPMTSSSAWPAFMCSGVITMTLTMTTWPSAVVSTPSRAPARARTTRSPRVSDPSWSAAASSSCSPRSTRAERRDGARARHSPRYAAGPPPRYGAPTRSTRAASSSAREVRSGSGRSSRLMTTSDEGEAGEGEDEAADEVGQADELREGPTRPDEVGSEDRPDRRGPDHEGQVAPAPLPPPRGRQRHTSPGRWRSCRHRRGACRAA